MADKNHFTYHLEIGDTVWLEPLGNANIRRNKNEMYIGEVVEITTKSIHIVTRSAWGNFKLPKGTSNYNNCNLGFGYNVFPTEEAIKTAFERRRKISAIRDLFNRNLWKCEDALTAEQVDEIYKICGLE